ncbi:MAG TPA: alpha/beta hydrolase [Candidatus Saccharimonadales bacterium]|nr:alpha/beta hydrolase [Candidatus Saccharimonadales bacterium]
MKHKRWWLAGRLLVVGSVSGLLIAATVANAAADSLSGSCQDVSFGVALATGQPANQTLSGTYCTPAVWASGAHDVDVLVHGATYNRSYWDWPQDAPAYSYVNRTLQAGRATFAYDQLGSGTSSHPLSTWLTIDAQAYVMHQAVAWLQGQGYMQITAVGHSFGSMTAIHEAAAYHDVNRLVVTGLFHANGPSALVGTTQFIPASLDPALLGYITTLPGSRGALFYDTATADPAVIAYDEAHKDMVSSTYFGTGLTEFEVPAGLNIAAGITAPVLSISGQEDAITCGITLDCTNNTQVAANEAAYYTATSSLTTATVPNTGHDLNLHPSAAASFGVINGWITTH